MLLYFSTTNAVKQGGVLSPLYYLSIFKNKMCDICPEFAYEYDLQFNPSKCQLIKYGSGTDCHFYFDGIQVKHNKKGFHVGHVIGPGTRQAMLKDMCHNFIWRVNALSVNVGFCNKCTKRQLFMSYCIFL